jgi:hypothetical protein
MLQAEAILGILEPLLRIMTYIAIISVSYRGIHALKIYIDKNSR